MLTAVAPDTSQLSVVDSPAAIVGGLASKVWIVGAVAAGGLQASKIAVDRIASKHTRYVNFFMSHLHIYSL
jgi:hypothetical protein